MHLELNSIQASKLKVVKVAGDPDRVKGHFPDFMIIGPQRTGTTWLDANITLHPELYLSIPKELYFFSRLKYKNSAVSRHADNFDLQKYIGHPKALLREWAKILYFDVYRTGMYKADTLEWYLRFFSDDYLTAFYRRRLTGTSDGDQIRMRGESTASYAIMDEDVIGDIMTLNPDLKVIMMVRDPIDRAWSHAKKDLVRNAFRKPEDVPLEAYLEFFRKESQVKAGHYSKLIEKWSAFLKPGNLFVGFFDDVSRRPRELLLDIFRFLEVDTDPRHVNPDADKVVNPTGHIRMPVPLRAALEELFGEERKKWMREHDLPWPEYEALQNE